MTKIQKEYNDTNKLLNKKLSKINKYDLISYLEWLTIELLKERWSI